MDSGMDVDEEAQDQKVLPEPRSVILETFKESYLLSPSNGDGDGQCAYDIALILEAECVLEEDASG